jgi:hypothetical protein
MKKIAVLVALFGLAFFPGLAASNSASIAEGHVPEVASPPQLSDQGENVSVPIDGGMPAAYLAIVDVYVTNRHYSDRVPPSGDYSYTGVSWVPTDGRQTCTVPFTEDGTGTRIEPADINADIGGDWVYLWVKYNWVAPTDDTPVLVDIAAHHWPYWVVSCPEGWEAAHGDAGGALTTRSDSDCDRIGLCVRYAPMNETETFISNLSLYKGGSNIASIPSLCPANESYWPMTQDGLDIHRGCGGDFMFLSYNEARKWPAMPTALPAPSAAGKVLTLKTYAPRVWLADGESYFPSSVDWAFGYMDRKWYDSAWRLFTRESLSTPSSVLPYFHGCDGSSTDNPCSLADTPVYAFWDEVEIDVSGVPVKIPDLVYFLYFPYNRGKEFVDTIWGSHVGDWEHVSVRLMPYWDGQTGWSLEPVQIYLPAHDFGRLYSWSQIDKELGPIEMRVLLPFVQGGSVLDGQGQPNAPIVPLTQVDSVPTHPVVYSAAGSHGNWRDPGSHPYRYIELVGTLTDVTSAGTAWDTWKQVEALDFDAGTGLGGSTWPIWMSADHHDFSLGNQDPTSGPIFRWGNPPDGCYGWPINYCRLETGPTGPVDKDSVWDGEILN